MWRYLAAGFLAVHGFVHLLGLGATWSLGELSSVSSAPSFPPGLEPGSPLVLASGVVWLLACLGFIAAAVGLALNKTWWEPLTAVAAVVSILICGMWWQSASIGIAVDIAILAVIALLRFRSKPVSRQTETAG